MGEDTNGTPCVLAVLHVISDISFLPRLRLKICHSATHLHHITHHLTELPNQVYIERTKVLVKTGILKDLQPIDGKEDDSSMSDWVDVPGELRCAWRVFEWKG